MPQTWRKQALEYNRVPVVSYRDAVWPDQDHPPANLGYYWDGMSHPKLNTHVFVAETVFFSFLALRAIAKRTAQAQPRLVDDDNNDDDDGPARLRIPDDHCRVPITVYSSFDSTTANIPSTGETAGCWRFGEYSRDKLGWIGSTLAVSRSESLVFETNVTLGTEKKVIVTYLKSYKERMGMVRVWFDSNDVVFSPSWNITAWHKERTQVPETMLIVARHLPPSTNVTVHFELVRGSARNATVQEDVFILLGITTC
jgi:hypothetical protein